MKSELPGPWRSLVRFGFRLLYNEMAFTYDSVSWLVSLGDWHSWQRAGIKHLNVASGARVLELAHGTANLQIDLRAAGIDSVGIDFSAAMGRIARRKMIQHGLVPRLARARAQALPFPAKTFAAVIATFPTEFIVDPATLDEVHRVLKDAGRLVIVPNGVLTKGGVAREGLEAAYRVTGQREAWPARVSERFTAAGFSLTKVVEPSRIGLAEVLIAEKN